jgi:hypothetical protein
METMQVILFKSRQEEEGRIPGGVVKYVDIRKNTECESTSLVLF